MHSGCELKESVAAVTRRMADMMPTGFAHTGSGSWL